MGYKVARSSTGIFLNQQRYALELLEEIGFTDCKPAKSAMESNHCLGLLNALLLTDVLGYRCIVGKLIYLTIYRHHLATLLKSTHASTN